MNPATIIREATADGVSLALSPVGTLKAKGEASVVNRWLQILKAYKSGILDALREALNDTHRGTATASRWWLLHYPDRDPVEVASFPPSTHAGILARYPEAIAAEPIHQEKQEPALAVYAARQDPEGWLRMIEVDDRGGPGNGK
jgi:hypothetical protein